MDNMTPNSSTQETVVKDDKKNVTNSKKNIRRVIAVIVVLIILCCSGCLAWRYLENRDGRTFEKAIAGELGQLENKSNAEIEAELNRVVAEGTMHISMNSNPVFNTGTSEGSLMIENSPANHYIQDIIITLKDTGEEIYHSGLLEPNYHIQTDVLAVDLDAGTYDCFATFIGYSVSESGEYMEVGTVGAEIKITVLS